VAARITRPPITEPAIIPGETGFGQVGSVVPIVLLHTPVVTVIVGARETVAEELKNVIDRETAPGDVQQPKALYPLWVKRRQYGLAESRLFGLG
jgi:hypothetical protein